jgi:hypothetical protein
VIFADTSLGLIANEKHQTMNCLMNDNLPMKTTQIKLKRPTLNIKLRELAGIFNYIFLLL